MKKQEGFKSLMREVINLIINFFKPCTSIDDEMLRIPRNLKWMGIKSKVMNLSLTIVTVVFAFMLQISNMMIEYRLILLGILLFILYRTKRLATSTLYAINTAEEQKFNYVLEDEVIIKGSKIIGNSAGKVVKYDNKSKLYKTMSNETMLNTIKAYLSNLWTHKIQKTFDILEIIAVIIMLIIAGITNNSIPKGIFITFLIVFSIVAFICSANMQKDIEKYQRKKRAYKNQQDMILNDILRVPAIVKSDLAMRVESLAKTAKDSQENVTKFQRKQNLSSIAIVAVELIGEICLIPFYLYNVPFNSIDLNTITKITASLVIIETAISRIIQVVELIKETNLRMAEIKEVEDDMLLILQAYHDNSVKTQKVEEIKLKPFAIKYIAESENDKPFTLTSFKELSIKLGDVVILYGPSGSGKSTFMKMLTGRIRLEKNVASVSSRYLFFDEKLKFGSLSIFEELFSNNEKPQLAKMQNIMENLQLWQEIKTNCVNPWKWMKEKQFDNSLSNGQRQRLILAKMLYFLDENIDIVVMDEATSGLDDKSESGADAENVLEYIVRYANRDKKRIVIISTHQNIDGMKSKLSSEFNFRSLQFARNEKENSIIEI